MFVVLSFLLTFISLPTSAIPDGEEHLSGHGSHIEEIVNRNVVICPDTVGAESSFWMVLFRLPMM